VVQASRGRVKATPLPDDDNDRNLTFVSGDTVIRQSLNPCFSDAGEFAQRGAVTDEITS